jgi:glycosyltransferase involved in cell wall biosynthesis
MGIGKIAAIILTRDEEVHIDRALSSLKGKVDQVHVIDSLSTDQTITKAESAGAITHQHPWVSYADQVNWALSVLPHDIDWVLRLDADEYLHPEADIKEELLRLTQHDPDLSGVLCLRSMVFMGHQLRFGGMGKKPVLRLFKKDKAKCADRLVDEHMTVDGHIQSSQIELIDHCLKGIGFWIEKHNKYARLEAEEYHRNLDRQNHPSESAAGSDAVQAQSRKRGLYYSLPSFLRPLAYFTLRYLVLGGFLDGRAGFYYSFMQAYWYRSLVEINIREKRDQSKGKA